MVIAIECGGSTKCHIIAAEAANALRLPLLKKWDGSSEVEGVLTGNNLDCSLMSKADVGLYLYEGGIGQNNNNYSAFTGFCVSVPGVVRDICAYIQNKE